MINGMIESYQEREQLQKESSSTTGCIAVVEEFDESKGVRLILPGAVIAGSKFYPYNLAHTFSKGQRVHLARESGTIIVEYPIGPEG